MIRLPAPPADFTAARRGNVVDLQFTVPVANADNSRPANLERIDVYGYTGSTDISDADLLKRGELVGSVDVKAPRDPDATVEPDQGDSENDVEPPTGKGLDQGAQARVEEAIASTSATPAMTGDRALGTGTSGVPLLGATNPTGMRTYVSVGITTRGRKGPLSKRVVVPLVPAPPPPAAPKLAVTESAVDLHWSGPAAAESTVAAEGVLPSRAFGSERPSLAFNVYEVPPSGSSPKPGPAEVRLTRTPVSETTYADARIEWGAEHCYEIRAVETIADVPIESAPSAPACVKLVDTFPPAPPKGLTAVATEGAINLIWEPNVEGDLAGYLVLRGVAPGETLTPLTPKPLTETTFRDTVAAGVRYVYAIEAVDKAGNASGPSNKVEEAAR